MAVRQASFTHGISNIRSTPAVVHLAWFAAVSAMSFLVPQVFSSLLELQHDVYYLIYFAATSGALVAYVSVCHIDLAEQLSARWRLSVGLGVAAGAFVVWSVLGRIDSTPHPTGIYFVFEIAWRGVLYGVVDALLLSAFPGVVAYNLLQRNVAGIGRRVSYGALTFVLVVILTAVYHSGFEDLRNREGITKPEIGNTIISIPVIASANPIGSVIAHSSMHIAAVTHSYESKDRLPPQVFVDEE
ncbi:MAG TPA: hypothetical protein VFX19_09385 [Dehalococcoidia bacterium]|jgi:hypothetical protein|nr:hypothetical protein [Dehalococcoidia bacterium]